MLTSPSLAAPVHPTTFVRHLEIAVDTSSGIEFIDLTATIAATVTGLGLLEGVVIVQTRHTTTGIMVNEHEPLLLDDLEDMFERVAPQSASYAHDDPGRRSVNVGPDERVNGHAHCRAALLHASESLAVSNGTLLLGRWQRVFLVELDGGQRRRVGLTLIGNTRP